MKAFGGLFVLVLCVGVQACEPRAVYTSPEDQAAQQDWQRLRSDAHSFSEIRFEDGHPAFISLQLALPGSDAVDRALQFIQSYRALFRLPDAKSTLYPKRVVRDGTHTHVFFGQRRGDTQVVGSEIAVHFDGDDVTSMNGRYLAEPWSASAAVLSSGAALGAALASAVVDGARSIAQPQLVYIDSELVGFKPKQGSPNAALRTHTAWRVMLSGLRPGDRQVAASLFVDAVDGSLLLAADHDFEHAYTLDIRTFDADPEPPATVLCPRGPALSASDDPMVLDVQREATLVTDFFHTRFGIHSWDNSAQMEIVLHAMGDSARYSSRCNRITFTDGYVVTDVFAHEATHGVQIRLGSEPSGDEARAIAEHVADVFGAVVDGNWRLGEDTPDGARRNMQDPTEFGQPDRYSEYDDPSDNWFNQQEIIHKNNGIGNKAAYLMSEGGTHRGVVVSGGLGMEKLARLYYPVITAGLSATATYPELRDVAVEQARDLVRDHRDSFVLDDVCTVNDAFAAVGLGRACSAPGVDGDGDGIPDDIDTCPSVADPLQLDSDHDGLGNLCDYDSDGDGVDEDGDGSGSTSDHPCRGTIVACDDNCPGVRNPDQRDGDGDGQGDSCDDRDGDRILDLFDNCPDTPNPGQQNFDGDAFDGDPNHGGDACDRDADGDGVVDFVSGIRCTGGATTGCEDNCVLLWDRDRTVNRDQTDTDGDGVGDICDNCEGFATLDINDADGDGRGNFCDPDADDDGVCNVLPPPPLGTPGLPFGGCGYGRTRSGDNCWLVKNPEQLDFDHDGVGTLCDQDEEALLSGEAVLLGEISGLSLLDGFLIPFDPCPNDFCGRFPFPDLIVRFFAHVAGVPLEISVVDSRGFVVAGPSIDAALEFNPPPAAFWRPGQGAQPFRGERFSLQVRAGSASQQLPDTLDIEVQIQYPDIDPDPGN